MAVLRDTVSMLLEGGDPKAAARVALECLDEASKRVREAVRQHSLAAAHEADAEKALASVAAERSRIAGERAMLDREREALDGSRRELRQVRDALAKEQRDLEAMRTAAHAERRALQDSRESRADLEARRGSPARERRAPGTSRGPAEAEVHVLADAAASAGGSAAPARRLRRQPRTGAPT